MDDSCVSWSVCGSPSNGIRTCLWHLNWLFGTKIPKWVPLPILDVGAEGSLVLSQCDVPCCVDSLPWEACPFLNGDEGGEHGGVEGKCGEGMGKEEGGESMVGMKNKWEKPIKMF